MMSPILFYYLEIKQTKCFVETIMLMFHFTLFIVKNFCLKTQCPIPTFNKCQVGVLQNNARHLRMNDTRNNNVRWFHHSNSTVLSLSYFIIFHLRIPSCEESTTLTQLLLGLRMVVVITYQYSMPTNMHKNIISLYYNHPASTTFQQLLQFIPLIIYHL